MAVSVDRIDFTDSNRPGSVADRAQAAATTWWPYASAGPTGQAEGESRGRRRRCSLSFTLSRPRSASLALAKTKRSAAPSPPPC